jgi:hypothetical protein
LNWRWPFRNRATKSGAQPREEISVPNAGPDFICIGAQKAGTTWLYRQLASHPDFWMPPRKELHYFNERGHAPAKSTLRNHDARDLLFLDRLRRLGTEPWLDLPGYGQLFVAKGSLLSGDITPAYCMLQEEIIVMVRQSLPQLKVIFLARDPVERVWSQLSLSVRSGGIPGFDAEDFDEVMHQLLHPLVLTRSYPSAIVARWRRHIPVNQFGLFFFDDLQNNPAELRRSIIAFLGGDPEQSIGGVPVEDNVEGRKMKLPLTDEVRSKMGEFFAVELKACAAQLGGPASAWPSRYGL